jgi:hypothetical protein
MKHFSMQAYLPESPSYNGDPFISMPCTPGSLQHILARRSFVPRQQVSETGV